MALGSQQGKVELMSTLQGLTHDIFVGKVVDNVRRESPVAMMFTDMQPGEYRLEGQNMVFAADLRFKTGALATSGKLPDYVGLDPVQGKVTPTRRYQRIALDNLVEKRASGPGAFEDLAGRIFDKMWDAWSSMECRHAIGASSGLLGVVESRDGDGVFTIKDAFGNAGTNPLAHISEGSILGWFDITGQSRIGGAGVVASIDYDDRQITVTNLASWETAVGAQIAATDLVYFATTNSTAADYFELERGLAPNGLGTIVDPGAALSTVFNIAEANYPRWKPFRKASVTFDHLEVAEHWLQLAAKRGFGVTPATDVSITFPANVAQLARGLMQYQQQASLGEDLKGGYRGITINGMTVVEDHFFYHDVMMTLNKDSLFRIPLGGQADFWGEDGSMWSRIADFDGKEAHVVDYMNYLCTHRGANSALTGITTDLTTADFEAVPNY